MSSTASNVSNTIDATLAAAGSKATYTGSGMVLSGWFFSSEFAVFVGILMGIAGFLVNWYYKHKIASAEIKFKLQKVINLRKLIVLSHLIHILEVRHAKQWPLFHIL